MTGFDALLHLQELDTTLDQLRYKHAHLPERDQLVTNTAAVTAIEKDLETAQAERDALGRDQKRIEDEVAIVETKAAEVHKKLYSGTVTNPKELQALQEDFDSLKRRQGVLEDQVIELMEAIEPVDERLATLGARRIALVAEGEEITTALAAAEQAVDGELAAASAEREVAVGEVPPELVTEYDRLRPQFAGIAVARLVGTNCNGCHLTLSSMALDHIRKLPPDALALCDECGRILIH